MRCEYQTCANSRAVGCIVFIVQPGIVIASALSGVLFVSELPAAGSQGRAVIVHIVVEDMLV